MSARVDTTLKLPPGFILILVFCTSFVTIHFIADGFLPHFWQIDLNSRTWQENHDLEDGDDGVPVLHEPDPSVYRPANAAMTWFSMRASSPL